MSSRGSTPRELYYLWERQQWEAGRIGLDEDRDVWSGYPRAAKERIGAAIDVLLVVKDAFTTALVPLVDRVPGEEAQVYLTTELVDEARHMVFFDRVATEHLSRRGSMQARVEEARRRLDRDWLSVLTELDSVAGRIRSDGPEGLPDAIAYTHIDVKERRLGRVLDELFEAVPDLVGLRSGIDLVRRDEGRHIAFARRFLDREVDAPA